MFDTIVIGGGMAGIVAARDLAAGGHSVVLLDGRNRLGGRVFTDTVLGSRLDLGGGYVHWTQANVWRELQRYGLDKTLKAPLSPEKLYWLADGKVHQQENANRHGLAEPLLKRMLGDARLLFPTPFDPHVDGHPNLEDETLADRIDKLQLSPYDRDVLEGALAGLVHDFSLHGVLQMLHGVSTHMGQVLSYLEVTGTWSCESGIGELVSAISADSHATVQMGAAVTEISDEDGSHVSVTTIDGRTIHAKAAVVAIPINTLAHVKISPPLPAAVAQMVQDRNPVKASKLWALVKGHVAPFAAMAPPGKHPINAIRVERRWGDNTLVLCMCADADAVPFGDSQVTAVQAALRKFVPEIDVLEVAGHDWNRDPFSRGGWMMHRPRHFIKGVAALMEPHGRIYFAGSDVTATNTGFIEGAMSSGAAAARAILRKYCH
ncbi:hypothetical protein K4F52_009256 [Lecanicillium sp. MT-2017a]|nr:hypothetical protein K4F52_009256 [Lecanicillium sp. MT-2017a]